MDRVSGWYKRRSQRFQFLFGAIVAVGLNVDAITVASHLFGDKSLRESVVKSAEGYARDRSTGARAERGSPPGEGTGASSPASDSAGPDSSAPVGEPSERFRQLRSDLGGIGYPIGWKFSGPNREDWLRRHRNVANLPDWVITPAWQIANSWPAPQACPAEPAKSCSMTLGKWLQAVAGWLISALAIMLGAPFWFDLLNKFMVIRSTVKPKEKSPDEGSEDRQPRARPQAARR